MKFSNTIMKFDFIDVDEPEAVVRITPAGVPNAAEEVQKFLAVKQDGKWTIADFFEGMVPDKKIGYTALCRIKKIKSKDGEEEMIIDSISVDRRTDRKEKEYNKAIDASVVPTEYALEFVKRINAEYILSVEGESDDYDNFICIGYKDILREDISWIACAADDEDDKLFSPWFHIEAREIEIDAENGNITIKFDEMSPIIKSKSKKKGLLSRAGSSVSWGLRHPVKATKRNIGHVLNAPGALIHAITHK